MKSTLEFVLRHGYSVLFVWVFLEQAGMPVPSIPILLAAGALAGQGRLNLAVAVTLPVLASLCSDTIWFELGRHKGSAVLGWLCRISLEPDSCVRRTEEVYVRLGARSLLLAKFIPGLNTVAPPLAGIFRMKMPKFLLFDALGALLWAGSFTALGFVLSDQLERVADYALRFGTSLVVLVVGGLGGFIAWKYHERRKFMRGLRVARMSPTELKRMMDAGEEVVIVDLRHSLDFEVAPEKIPGALQMDPEKLEEMQAEIPRDREIVLYCT
jgi:membrane protein DedA with SNARE-associated domain